MPKPIITAVGNQGNYQAPGPVMSKIVWSNSTFTAPGTEQLKGNDLPSAITSGSSPYVYSFINPDVVNAPQFRISLNNYTMGASGNPGSSNYWFYNATGTGSNAWVEKATATLNPPFNPNGMKNISYSGTNYLVVADYDSTGNSGGTLCLVATQVPDPNCQ